MFNIKFLHVIREFEYIKIIAKFSIDAKILEIGGGTGYQARRLTDDGFQVQSIDVENSNYANQLEFPVQFYDGKNIPFPDASFNVIFSSNVFEHVADLPHLQREIQRVLKPGGYCVHLMPSGAWRFWTIIAHYTEFTQKILNLLLRLFPRKFSKMALFDSFNALLMIPGTIKSYLIVPRHGETGNAFSEIWTFSGRYWKKQFADQNFTVESATSAGLFYTGHMILGGKLSLSAREKISKWLGCACLIYVVRPKTGN